MVRTVLGWLLGFKENVGRGRRGGKYRFGRSPIGWLFRMFTPILTGGSILAVVAAGMFGLIDLPSIERFRGTLEPEASPAISATAPPPGTIRSVSLVRGETAGQKSPSSIRVATYNVQTFGPTKADDAATIERLASLFMLFDVVAVQEIRGDPRLAVERLIQAIRRRGGNYHARLSRPIGRPDSTGRIRHSERYGFFYDLNRIALIPQSDYVVDDAADRMHREPMVASFETRVQPIDSRRPFRFTLINVHTDPDEVRGETGANEINVLDDVYVRVAQFEASIRGEDDVMLVGDLNVARSGLAELGDLPGVTSLIDPQPTNVARTKQYDHILVRRDVTAELTGRGGVVDVARLLSIDAEAERAMSDHLPVWAEFGVYEID